MRNKNLLTRSALSPLGGHKILEHEKDAISSMQASTPTVQRTVLKPGRHKQVTIAPDPEGSRYTLSLKIEKTITDLIASKCGSSDLGSQSGAKRSLTLQFRAHLLDAPIERARKSALSNPTSLRLDIRLPETFVLQVLVVENAAPFEPRATVLARNFAPKFTAFVQGLG